jgi:hypothetical protein
MARATRAVAREVSLMTVDSGGCPGGGLVRQLQPLRRGRRNSDQTHPPWLPIPGRGAIHTPFVGQPTRINNPRHSLA